MNYLWLTEAFGQDICIRSHREVESEGLAEKYRRRWLAYQRATQNPWADGGYAGVPLGFITEPVLATGKFEIIPNEEWTCYYYRMAEVQQIDQ